MSYILIVTIAIVIFSLIFDFINGFHDTANAVATAVSTRALTPRRAIFHDYSFKIISNSLTLICYFFHALINIFYFN